MLFSNSFISRAIMQDYVRAVLTAARPGLAATQPSAVEASKYAAVRLATYRAALSLLAVQEPALSERQAAVLVSVLEIELGSCAGCAVDLSEVRLAGWSAGWLAELPTG